MTPETEKECRRCHVPKPLSEFQVNARRRNGLHDWCRSCCNAAARASRERTVTPESKRRANLASRYGMTLEEYDSMMEAQGGVCAICRRPPLRPVVDHDHVTGRVRGILCHGCNIKLPAIEDAAFRVPALAYLGVAE